MKAYLRHPLLAIACLLLAAYLTAAWKQRQSEVLNVGFMISPDDVIAPRGSLAWLDGPLGALPKTAEYPDLQPINASESLGLELLDVDSAVARACRLELARWAAPGELQWQTKLLELSEIELNGVYLIHLVALGKESQVLSWTEHLLACPSGQGYLTDPARVHLSVEEDGQLKIDLAIRIWPSQAFIPLRDQQQVTS